MDGTIGLPSNMILALKIDGNSISHLILSPPLPLTRGPKYVRCTSHLPPLCGGGCAQVKLEAECARASESGYQRQVELLEEQLKEVEATVQTTRAERNKLQVRGRPALALKIIKLRLSRSHFPASGPQVACR